MLMRGLGVVVEIGDNTVRIHPRPRWPTYFNTYYAVKFWGVASSFASEENLFPRL